MNFQAFRVLRFQSHFSVLSGDTIDLSSSSKKSAVALDPSKLKALMALRGKALEKQSGNYVPARKRKADEEEKQKRREKVGRGNWIKYHQSG